MGLDRKRLAEAIDAHALRDHLTHDCDRGCADSIADEYDRLTAEWQERLRSVNIAPSATPTRSKQ